MKIYNEIINLKDKNIALALGMFDGMHLGHRAIVSRAIAFAKELNGLSAVLTFQNHPMSVLDMNSMPLAIGSSEIRADILSEMGVDILMDIPFTKEFSLISPHDFLKILQENLKPKYIVVGKNFTFGKGAVGDGDLLIKEGKNYGFDAQVLKTVLSEGKPISSTRIRALIKEGNLKEVNDFLGRPLSYIGKVMHGDKRGRAIGFPTANLKIAAGKAVLPNGAYASRVKYKNKIYNAISNIGNNPTFNLNETRLETNIFNFSQNIYDEKIEVMFIAKLRDEKKFANADELVSALKNDKKKLSRFWDRNLI